MSDTESKIRKYLAEEFGMNDTEIDEMLEIFLESLERLTVEIKESISSWNAGQLKTAGHSLKGVAANIGAEHIAALGKSIEDTGVEGTPEQAASLLAELNKALDNLKQQS